MSMERLEQDRNDIPCPRHHDARPCAEAVVQRAASPHPAEIHRRDRTRAGRRGNPGPAARGQLQYTPHRLRILPRFPAANVPATADKEIPVRPRRAPDATTMTVSE